MNGLSWGDKLKLLIISLSVFLVLGCSSVPEEISSEYYNIGNAYFDVGDYQKAIDYYMKALDDDHPMANKIRYNLAVAYTESGRVSQGLGLFDVLLQSDPENLLVLQSKAYAHYLLGDDEISIEVYDQILDVFEYDETALFNKALILMNSDRAAARSVLDKLYVVDTSVEVVLLLGELYLEDGDKESYAILLEQSVVENPDDSRLLEDLVEYYAIEGSFFKAIEYIDKLLSVDTYEPVAEMLFKKAVILFVELDDYENGYETIVKALDAGFDDKSEIEQLLNSEVLSGDGQLREYMKLRGYL